jgi:uncharacterized protein (TIGR03067 family)
MRHGGFVRATGLGVDSFHRRQAGGPQNQKSAGKPAANWGSVDVDEFCDSEHIPAKSRRIPMRTFALFIGLAVTVPASAADVKSWEGHYNPVSIKFDEAEQVIDSDAKARMTLVVKDGEYRMFWQKDKTSELHLRLFTADLKVEPATKSFTLTVKDGQKKGQNLHGIYEQTGTELKICYGPADKPRPTTFNAAKGSGCFCEVWVREKK